MRKYNRYIFLWSLSFILLGLMTTPQIVSAQETDTTRQELELNNQSRNLNIRQKFDRSMSGGMMTEMGIYQMPDDKQYYQRPFKGQHYLDQAVEAYRKEMEDNIGGGWFWNFLKAVSPYINNQFQFGVYDIYDMEVVDRDNPLFKSYKNPEKKQ